MNLINLSGDNEKIRYFSLENYILVRQLSDKKIKYIIIILNFFFKLNIDSSLIQYLSISFLSLQFSQLPPTTPFFPISTPPYPFEKKRLSINNNQKWQSNIQQGRSKVFTARLKWQPNRMKSILRALKPKKPTSYPTVRSPTETR